MNSWKILKENCNYEINKNGVVRNLKTKEIVVWDSMMDIKRKSISYL